MNIGRNNPCLCGSGKKYKKCCIDKADDADFSNPFNVFKTMNTSMKQRYIKQCVHPIKSECNERIVKSHSIQNNRILNKLAVEGYVITMAQENLFFMTGQQIGRKLATTFSGF
jgi:hypothetical protein